MSTKSIANTQYIDYKLLLFVDGDNKDPSVASFMIGKRLGQTH